MPIEKQTIAAVSMSGPCDASACCNVVTVGAGQMVRMEDVTSSNIAVGRIFYYGAPWPILVVGKVNGGGRSTTLCQLTSATPLIAAFVAPAVDDVANGLFLVRIAGTAKYLDVTVVISNSFLCQ